MVTVRACMSHAVFMRLVRAADLDDKARKAWWFVECNQVVEACGAVRSVLNTQKAERWNYALYCW